MTYPTFDVGEVPADDLQALSDGLTDHESRIDNIVAPGYTAHTPTITVTGGGFAIGTSTVSGVYRRITDCDEICYKAYVSFAGATFGSGIFEIDLPVTAHSSEVNRATGAGWVLDAGTIRRPVSVHLNSQTLLRLVSDGGDVAVAVPFTWANGDAFAFSFNYRPA